MFKNDNEWLAFHERIDNKLTISVMGGYLGFPSFREPWLHIRTGAVIVFEQWLWTLRTVLITVRGLFQCWVGIWFLNNCWFWVFEHSESKNHQLQLFQTPQRTTRFHEQTDSFFLAVIWLVPSKIWEPWLHQNMVFDFWITTVVYHNWVFEFWEQPWYLEGCSF